MKDEKKTKKQLIEELEALQKQVDKLNKTETRAKQAGKPSLAAQYWQTMFDAINDAVSIIDRNGKITQCNKTMASLLQKPTSEIIGHACWELVHASTKPIPECPIVRMKKSLKRETPTLPLMGRCFEVTADPIFDKAGKFNGAVHIIVDITNRKKMEEDLHRSRAAYQDLVENLNNIIYTISIDGLITYVSPVVKEHLGFSPTELIGRHFKELIHPGDSDRILKAFHDVLENRLYPSEYRQLKKNSEVCWVSTSSRPVYENNKLIGIQGVLTDITERKRAEETMERLRHQYELILNSAGEGILGLDLQGNHTFINPAAARMLGYEVEELIDRHSHTTWHHSRTDGSPYPEEECPIYAAYRDGAVHIVDDEVFWRKDGTSFSVRYTSTPILEDGKIVGAVVSFIDITKRKKAEEALRETRDYLEKLLNYANAPIVVWDLKFTITGFNHAFERLTGYKDKEVIGKNLHMLFPEASQEESLKKIVPTSSSEYWKSMEIPILCKDGSIRIVLWNSANIYAKDVTTLIATIAQGQDITGRKEAEEKIRRFNRLYSMLSEINEAIIRIRKRKELFEKACRITVEKGLFRMTWIELIDPDSHSLNSIVHGECGEEYLDKIRISIKEAPERLGPISTAIRAGKYVICNDFKDDSCIHPCRDEAIKCGYYSMAAFPLRTGINIIGAINFYSGEPHFFDDEEISALTQLSEDISFALEHIEQQEQLQKRIEELEKFYEMGIGRELKIKGLKKEMEELKAELSQHTKESTRNKKYNSNERA